jgi:hypothetical protein
VKREFFVTSYVMDENRNWSIINNLLPYFYFIRSLIAKRKSSTIDKNNIPNWNISNEEKISLETTYNHMIGLTIKNHYLFDYWKGSI